MSNGFNITDMKDAVIERARKDDRVGLTDEQKEILEGPIRRAALSVISNSGIKNAQNLLRDVYAEFIEDIAIMRDGEGKLISPSKAASDDIAALKQAFESIKEERTRGRKPHHPKEDGGVRKSTER